MSRVSVLPADKAVDEEAARVTSKDAERSWMPNWVDAKLPVLGLNVNLVEVTF